MVNYIVRFLRARERSALLAQINREHPGLAPAPGEDKLLAYILQELQQLPDPPVEYDQGKPVQRLPDLLLRSLEHWTDRPAINYSRAWLLKEIETARLRALIRHYETLVSCQQKRHEFYQQQQDTLVHLTEEANRLVDLAQQITTSADPDKRLN